MSCNYKLKFILNKKKFIKKPLKKLTGIARLTPTVRKRIQFIKWFTQLYKHLIVVFNLQITILKNKEFITINNKLNTKFKKFLL